MEDITFYTEEFRIGDAANKRKHQSTSKSSDDLDATFSSTLTDPFLSTISSLPNDNEMFYSDVRTNETDGDESDAGSDDEDEIIYRNEMVMFGQLLSRQEIRVNMKLVEHIEGPKVSLQMTICPITLFFTPRQLHMLLLLCDILLNGETSNETLKEVSPQHFVKDEGLRKYPGGLLSHQTWSGDDYECNNSEMNSARDMHCINTLRPVGSDSVFSSNSSMSSSIGSSASQGTSKRKRAIERDQNADISHFSIRVAGIYVVLLHDDVLVPTSLLRFNEAPLNECSVEKLRFRVDHFFSYFQNCMKTCSFSDQTKVGTILKHACDINHLRVMMSPIIVDGEERRTVKGNCTKLNVSIPKADIHEILGDLYLPVLEFYRKDPTLLIPEQPEITINMEKTFYHMRGSMGKQYVAPRLNLGIKLGIAKLDLDISILDRLNALFSSPFSCYMSDLSENDLANELSPSSQKIVQPKSKLEIQSENLSLVLRFPIVDLRPLHDPEKRPWWQRNVRQDFLQIKFVKFHMNFISPGVYDIMSDEINIYYHETDKAPSIYIGKASFHENTSNRYYSASTDYPRIVIQLPTDSQLQELNETFISEQKSGKGEDTDSDPTSGESIKINPNREKESTPFSAKKVCRESDTPHGKKDDGKLNLILNEVRHELTDNFR